MSRVYARVDGLPLGVLSLALSHASGIGTPQQPLPSNAEADLAPAVKTLCELVAQLVPSSAKLSLSIASLNERYWSPRKDMAANRLISGPLQLAKDQGTCLLLDESAMQQGRLNDHGCRNLRALQTLVESQTGEYFCELYFLSRTVPRPGARNELSALFDVWFFYSTLSSELSSCKCSSPPTPNASILTFVRLPLVSHI